MICRCGHPEELHAYGRNRDKQRVRMSCTHQDGFKFCGCNEYHEVKSELEEVMAKEKAARVKKPKSEGRTPRLAGLVDSPLTIYMTTGGKEYKGTVLTSGIIKVDEKEFTSPSSAGSYILGNDKKGKPRQVDGWKSWTFNKDGERVMLNTLRGGKSPLKTETPKRDNAAKRTRKAVDGASKTRRTPKKPRTRKPKTNGAAHEQSDAANTGSDTGAEATA